MLPVIRGSWREIERGGVALMRVCGINYISLRKVCYALNMDKKELLRLVRESGTEDYPPPSELMEGATQ